MHKETYNKFLALGFLSDLIDWYYGNDYFGLKIMVISRDWGLRFNNYKISIKNENYSNILR
jgi:hypothetical protein